MRDAVHPEDQGTELKIRVLRLGRFAQQVGQVSQPVKTEFGYHIIWVKDIKDRGAMNEVWTPWLPKDGAPVRACVQSEMAAPAVLVEIMVTACK